MADLPAVAPDKKAVDFLVERQAWIAAKSSMIRDCPSDQDAQYAHVIELDRG